MPRSPWTPRIRPLRRCATSTAQIVGTRRRSPGRPLLTGCPDACVLPAVLGRTPDLVAVPGLALELRPVPGRPLTRFAVALEARAPNGGGPEPRGVVGLAGPESPIPRSSSSVPMPSSSSELCASAGTSSPSTPHDSGAVHAAALASASEASASRMGRSTGAAPGDSCPSGTVCSIPFGPTSYPSGETSDRPAVLAASLVKGSRNIPAWIGPPARSIGSWLVLSANSSSLMRALDLRNWDGLRVWPTPWGSGALPKRL